MKRIIILALAAVICVSATQAAADVATVQSVKVFEAVGGPPNFNVGKKVGGAKATVYRNDNGLGIIIKTKKLSEGAFTAWLFECVGGTAENCDRGSPPNAPIFCSADTAKSNGKVHISCGVSEVMPGTPGLTDSRNPFVVLFLDHGPIDPEMIDLQLSIPMPPPTVPVQTVKVEAGGVPVDNDDDDDSDSDSD
jgi:hypothetical protein